MAMRPRPIRQWREHYARRCLRVDFEPLADSTFHASVKPIFPERRIVRATLSPGFLFRDEDLLRDGDDSIGFVVAQSREPTARHLEREIRLAPGDATMMLMGATGGVGWSENSTLFDMLIPPAEWKTRGTRPEDGLMQRLSGKSEAVQLPRRCLGSVEKGLTVSFDNRSIIRRHIIDLTVLAGTTRCSIGESSASAVVATLKAAALDYIASHFSDPELSLAKMAQSLGFSPRYLQRPLASSGTSFTAHVTELRLKHAFMLITAQDLSDVCICNIGLQAGFSDISHFNRLFRSRFGDTPKGIRANQQTAYYAN
jgi:AraC-like DNA-binding protein